MRRLALDEGPEFAGQTRLADPRFSDDRDELHGGLANHSCIGLLQQCKVVVSTHEVCWGPRGVAVALVLRSLRQPERNGLALSFERRWLQRFIRDGLSRCLIGHLTDDHASDRRHQLQP